MRLRYSLLIAACFSLAACSPSAEEIKTILNAHIAGLGEEGSTQVTNVEQTEKNIYSGTYSVSKDTLTAYVYPFTAIIKKDQVTQFFKDTDETKVTVVNKQTGTEETKAQYDERIKKEEEKRLAEEKEKAKQAAAKKASSTNSISFPMVVKIVGYNEYYYLNADGSFREEGGLNKKGYWDDWSGGLNGRLIVLKDKNYSGYFCLSFTDMKYYSSYDRFRSKEGGNPFTIVK